MVKPPAEAAGFDTFWTAYPRKVGKAEARNAWEKIAPDADLLTKILAALAWQVTTWEEVKYIPHAATWLNKRRWEDEQTAEPPDADDIWATARRVVPCGNPKCLVRAHWEGEACPDA